MNNALSSTISILIIAHNEEEKIRACIESILTQTKQANEIICIAHNCTDKTTDIVKEYPQITLYELLSDETGPIPAREYGFEKAYGSIIACLDGDSYVSHSWLEEITKPFIHPGINSVSGFPILLYGKLFSYLFFLQGLPLLKSIFHFYFWGSNFACRKNDYEAVGGMKKCREINRILGLHYPAEDCILSFLLQRRGGLAFARKARSFVYIGRFFNEKNRGIQQHNDLVKIKKYFQL